MPKKLSADAFNHTEEINKALAEAPIPCTHPLCQACLNVSILNRLDSLIASIDALRDTIKTFHHG